MIVLKACAKCHMQRPWTTDFYPETERGMGYVCLECEEKAARDSDALMRGAEAISDADIRHSGATKQHGTWFNSNIDLFKKPQAHPTTRELLTAIKETMEEDPGKNVYSKVITTVPLALALEIYLYEVQLMLIHRYKKFRAVLDEPFPEHKWELARNVLCDCMDSQEFELEGRDGR